MLKQLLNLMVIIMSLQVNANNAILNYDGVILQVPQKPFKTNALEITTKASKEYSSWSATESNAAFEFFKEIPLLWQEKKIGEHYLVYGHQNLEGNQPFSWQILPYYKTSNILSRIWQQIVVLWRVVFGGFVATKDYINEQTKKYSRDFENWKSEEIVAKPSNEPGKDFLCNPEKISTQSVFEGNRVRIVYPHAPIGFGGERLHFFITPKRHVEDFNQLTIEENAEVADLSKKLITYFKNNRNSQEVYLLWKYGVDAGQTLDHCNLHVILTSSKAQSIWDKLTVFKNIFLGSSPLPADQLKAKVDALKTELVKLAECKLPLSGQMTHSLALR